MKIKEWLKWFKNDFVFRMKDFISIVKFMYKDKVDMWMHIIIVVFFIVGFFTNPIMMGAAGFIGLYAFTVCLRAAYWKRIVVNNKEMLEKLT
jgi:hypothetical protein